MFVGESVEVPSSECPIVCEAFESFGVVCALVRVYQKTGVGLASGVVFCWPVAIFLQPSNQLDWEQDLVTHRLPPPEERD